MPQHATPGRSFGAMAENPRVGALMSHTSELKWVHRLIERFRASQPAGGDSVSPASTASAPTDVDDATSMKPAAGPDRPPLFAVRTRGVPGHEFSQLLRIPKALDPERRRAHLLAVRGLMHARQARHEAANTAFGEALSLDPKLDLSELPTFWDLPRAGCEAAVQAYRDAGLASEATTLNARLRQSLRPRSVPLSTGSPIRRAN